MAYINGKKVISKVICKEGGTNTGGIEGVTETDTKVYVNTEKNVEIGDKPKKIAIYNQDYTITNYGQNATLINWGSIIGENFLAENIKKDVKIFGKTGTYDNGIEGVTDQYGTITIGENTTSSNVRINGEKHIDVYSEDGTITVYKNCKLMVLVGNLNLYHVDAGGGSVTANNLEPQNIKKGVTILGVTGTYEGE